MYGDRWSTGQAIKALLRDVVTGKDTEEGDTGAAMVAEVLLRIRGALVE